MKDQPEEKPFVKAEDFGDMYAKTLDPSYCPHEDWKVSGTVYIGGNLVGICMTCNACGHRIKTEEIDPVYHSNP